MSGRHTRAAVAVAVALAVAGVASSTSAQAADGTGTVVDTLTASVLAGGLTIAGAGANVALGSVPGSFSPAAGATLLTMTDTTGSDNGWVVTATYAAPTAPGVLDLGGANVKVTASNSLPSTAIVVSLAANNITTGLSPASEQTLTSPVAVLTTGAASGAGISTATVGYKVRVPADAQVQSVYGGTVTYTIASVR